MASVFTEADFTEEAKPRFTEADFQEEAKPRFTEADFSENAQPDLSTIKPSPYQQTVPGRFGESLKPESGMESGTEFTTALATGLPSAIAALPGEAIQAGGRAALGIANLPTDVANRLRGQQPGMPGYVERLEDLPRPSLPRFTGDKYPRLAGVGNVLAQTGEQVLPVFAPPEVGLTLPLLGVNGLVARVGAAAFGYEVLKSLPEEVRQAIATVKDPNASTKDKVEAVGKPTVNSILAALMTHGAVGKASVKAPLEDVRARTGQLAPDVIRLRPEGEPVFGSEPLPLPSPIEIAPGGAVAMQLPPRSTSEAGAPDMGDVLSGKQEMQRPIGGIVKELKLEGVTDEDARALASGAKTVDEVVKGAFSKFITPAWNASVEQSRGGHGEAWIAGYNDAIARLSYILEHGAIDQDFVPPSAMIKPMELPKFEETKPVEPEAPPVVTQGAPPAATSGIRGTISFETLDEPSGEWQKQDKPYVISKSTIPGSLPWRMTVFGGPNDAPVPIGHIELESPTKLPTRTLQDLAEQLGRYTRKYSISDFQISGENYFHKPKAKAPPTEAPPPVVESRPPEPAISEEATVGKGKEGVRKEPWEMTLNEFAGPKQLIKGSDQPKPIWTARAFGHYRAVREAVEQGKPVPPEVLADYPDLQPKPPQPSTTPPPIYKSIEGAKGEEAAGPPKSTGHIAFVGNDEYYVKGRTLYRAQTARPIGKSGMRKSSFTTELKGGKIKQTGEDIQTFITRIKAQEDKFAEHMNAQIREFGRQREAEHEAMLREWEEKQNPPKQSSQPPPPAAAKVQTEVAKAEPKFTLTFQQFLDAPREGPLLEALRSLPREPLSPEKLATKERYEKAAEAIEKAGLGWIYDRTSSPSAARNVEAAIRRLPKAKQKLVKEYEDALTANTRTTPEERTAQQRKLYDKAVAAGIIAEPTPAPPAATGEGMAKPEDHGIAASVRKKWTSATDDSPLGSEAGFISLKPLQDLVDYLGPKVRASIAAVKEAVGENFDIRKANDYRRAVFGWSAKLQRSFGEAAGAQREIREKVTDPIRRAGITNWIQAAGDATELARRKAATEAWRDPVTGKPHPKQKELVAGYDAALHLTPEELSVANDVKTAFNDLHARGTRYDVLHSFLDNYVTQQWDLGRSPKGMGTSRKLRDKFRFDKARKFGSYFEGEQAGYVPKTKDISSLLPMYLHEMNSVIAARQLVQDMSKGFASDGRPLLAPRGVGVAVDGPKGKATLILPGVPRGVKVGPAGAKVKVDTKDYVFLESQPALHEWVYATKDSAGNPVFNRADLVVHPEVATRFKNALGRSAIQEWYESRTSAAAAIPKAIVRGLDQAQSETKKTMLGFLTPFHQVQEGTHAIGHKVNPFFNNPEIDLVNNPAQMDAARHGLMLLPDRASAQNFMEGFRQSGLMTKIPIIGPLADHYSYYLFHEYIPGIKFKTYEAILKRNTARYAGDIAAGRATLEDVKILSAEQANAAYGHLNYADLGRNPTIQHLMRLGLLAPDFLEARARFAGQAINGLSGEKIGREQLIALATLAVAQATLSWTMAQITGGQWDAKDPFTFHVGNRKFTMRSVPEDLYRSVKDHRAFWYARLNPIIGRGAIQYLSGTDWRGQKVGAGQTTKELLTQPVPLALRPLVGLGNTPLSSWEEIAGASGLKISRYSNVGEVSKMAHSWMASSPNPKIRAAEERYQHTSFPDSDYKPLREALIKGDMSGARTAYKNLLKTRPPGRIMQTFLSDRPFTGSREAEAGFVASLSDKDRALYESARRERRQLAVKLQQMLQGQSGGTIPSFVPTVQQR